MKKYFKNINLLFFLYPFLFGSCQKSDNYKLFITLENAPFDSLFLQDYTKGRDIWLQGRKIHEFTWIVTIPDSIVWNSENMILRVSKYDFINNSLRSVRFIAEKRGKDIIVANIGVEGKENNIHAVYLKQTVFQDVGMLIKIGNKDSIVLGDAISEDFKLILQDDSSDITIRSECPYFSWFINLNNEEISYDEYLAQYIAISKKYPDSRFLICNLSRMLSRYKSKKDVQKIYDNFSDKHKNTLWAKNIDRFLYGKFQNISLPALDKSRYENIVQDTSKYNLVIFTASWCKPCIEEIPILEEIYSDLNKNLRMTYISIDEENTVESFQNLIHKKNIPWRALLAFKDIQGVKEKYYIDGIPQCILVYPNGNMDMIDVRIKGNKDKLYSLCGK